MACPCLESGAHENSTKEITGRSHFWHSEDKLRDGKLHGFLCEIGELVSVPV